jgi:hypothetical protein
MVQYTDNLQLVLPDWEIRDGQDPMDWAGTSMASRVYDKFIESDHNVRATAESTLTESKRDIEADTDRVLFRRAEIFNDKDATKEDKEHAEKIYDEESMDRCKYQVCIERLALKFPEAMKKAKEEVEKADKERKETRRCYQYCARGQLISTKPEPERQAWFKTEVCMLLLSLWNMLTESKY